MIVRCAVTDVIQMSSSVYRVLLKPEVNIVFKAGQYLKVHFNSKSYAFSIASSPLDQDLIELHIRKNEGIGDSCIVGCFQQALNENILVDVPHGDAWLREDSDRPILLMAGGTGVSYVSGILKKCISSKMVQPIYLYWGVKNIELLYVHKELIDLVATHDNVYYVSAAEYMDDVHHLVKKGTVLDVILNDFNNLSQFDIYMCGPVPMIKAAKVLLGNYRNANLERMFSDALAYV
ncbi:flavin reductase luxG [Candidatus Photodesmus blepharus]|uniref:Flavin reductase luxG n=1 Tax=Candidatus Photodesmus blepharonis TaxID=1179155 RepID=M9NKN2_9GAMM|nr:NAD(P)H-flavin reductase [Candidatus Photodesmus blepharus]AFJ93048.1 putative flavin reductase [Candidatus Photodesmus blepharus]KEY91251.1 flavin reductase luxG [Candidatus Photodesmus blepharus]